MQLSLKELQMLAEAEFSIEDTRKDLNRLVEYFTSQEEQETYLDIAFVKERKLPMDIAKEQKIFFIDEGTPIADFPEEFRQESFGFCRKNHFVFDGRLVYPVMDVRGDVMGFCGWDKFSNTKYLDSRTYGYTAKQTTFYGMEKLPEYYRSGKPIYVVEGIVCCLYLRSIGLQAIALLGSSMSPYVIQILKRVEKRLVFIPDNDVVDKQMLIPEGAEEVEEFRPDRTSGEHFVQQAKRLLPKAIIIQSIIAKDVDDTRKVENGKWESIFQQELMRVIYLPYGTYTTIRIR